MGVFNKAHAATPWPDAATERFSVSVSGEGRDIILIPGLGSAADTWTGTVAHLSGYRVHVLNLAGFAGEPAGANATGDVLVPSVEAIDAYIKANHLDHPVVVGHSMGGLMALMLAKAHPEDAGKLVIADALPYIGVIFNPAATVPMVEPQAAAMRDGMIATPADAFAAQQAAGMARMVTSPDDVKRVAQWSVDSDRRVFAESLYEDMTTDLRPDLGQITTPAVVIFPVSAAAGQDPAQTEAFYKMQYANMPKVSFARIDNSLHFMMLDQPDAFYAALDKALQ
jgi:pimeloyl-ACP methyl ester carboxylesterase